MKTYKHTPSTYIRLSVLPKADGTKRPDLRMTQKQVKKRIESLGPEVVTALRAQHLQTPAPSPLKPRVLAFVPIDRRADTLTQADIHEAVISSLKEYQTALGAATSLAALRGASPPPQRRHMDIGDVEVLLMHNIITPSEAARLLIANCPITRAYLQNFPAT